MDAIEIKTTKINATEIKAIKKVIIMAGGTGGHVIPALAVAKALTALGIEVHWLGTREGIEARLVEKANIPISYINVQAIRGKGWLTRLFAPVIIAKALYQSYRIIKRHSPDLLLSMGGYAAGPGSIAGWLQKKPLIIHEQNAIAGGTNRILARFARQIMVAFPQAFSHSAFSQKVCRVGNPVRAEIMDLPIPQTRFEQKSPDEFNVLVLGGSQGAAILNEKVPEAIALLSSSLSSPSLSKSSTLPIRSEAKSPLSCPYSLKVWHQTGNKQKESTTRQYQQYAIHATVNEFIDDMASAYRWADVVICRSGALTIAEICASGIPGIFIPFPHAADDHQTANARYLTAQEAGILLPQSQLTSEKLKDLLQDLLLHPEKRLNMANKCRALALPNATEKVVQYCLEVSCD